MLEALLAAAEHRPDAGAAFGRLDTLLLQVGERRAGSWKSHGGARPRAICRVRSGQPGSARDISGLNLLLPREEGRLAALVGDREGAIKAYSHYLALRYNPEPSVKPEVDRVRAELARLVGEPR